MRNKYPLAPASRRARPLSPPGFRLTSGSRAVLRVLPDVLAGVFLTASCVACALDAARTPTRPRSDRFTRDGDRAGSGGVSCSPTYSPHSDGRSHRRGCGHVTRPGGAPYTSSGVVLGVESMRT